MLSTEPILPWVESQEDRLFKRLVVIFIVLFLLAGIILNNLSLPEVQQKKLAEVAPRLAQLILEKKKVAPPPVKKVEKKVVKKPEDKPLPIKPVKKPDSRAAAKKTAQQSGLIALSDELADLRESFDFSDIAELPQHKSAKQAKTVISTSALLTAKASQGSKGIKTNTLNRKIKSSRLTQRDATAINSTIVSDKLIASSSTSSMRAASRSQEEIERVFQKNKGAIFSIYNRELRKDPTLHGKVVIELTIEANGTVSKCSIVSSELRHDKLEKRLLSKIKKFVFTSKNVPVITVTYPIDFLPS